MTTFPLPLPYQVPRSTNAVARTGEILATAVFCGHDLDTGTNRDVYTGERL